MTKQFIRIAAAACIVAASIVVAHAQTTPPVRQVIYKLEKDTLFTRGCFAPCLCPVWMTARVRGTFVLTHTGFDGLFDNYTVTDVNWVAYLDGSRLPIKGSGTYKVGGEFAIQQQLALDLVVGTDPVQHYDSGLVTGPSDFPRINLSISIHGGYCFDTVIDVRSRPAMHIAVSDTGLTWDPVPQTTGYDVVRGDLRTLLASGGDFTLSTTGCLASDTPDTSLFFADEPAPGEGYWFLARWIEGNVRDSYDEDDAAQTGSCDAAIEAASAACP